MPSFKRLNTLTQSQYNVTSDFREKCQAIFDVLIIDGIWWESQPKMYAEKKFVCSAEVENEWIYLESIETCLLHGNSIQIFQLGLCDIKFHQSEQYLNEQHGNWNPKKNEWKKMATV